MIKLAILEDQKNCADKLSQCIRKWNCSSSIGVEISVYETGQSLLFDLEDKKFNVVFLDIIVPGDMTGMNVAQEIRKTDQDIIILFLTGTADYIQDGYDVEAMQYLLKPIHYVVVEKQMNKISNKLKLQQEKHYVFSTKGTTHKIKYSEICYFFSLSQHIDIYTTHGVYTQWIRIGSLESTLPQNFARCSKSYIVNLDMVTSKKSTKEIIINNELRITIGKAYAQSFDEAWMNLYG